MTSEPPPLPESPSPEPPSPEGLLSEEQALQALAAGELSSPEAARWQARMAQDSRLRAAYEEFKDLEERLRAEPLLPLPRFLVPRILAATTAGTPIAREPAHVRPHVLLARVAACALIAFASWLAFSGEVPTWMNPHAPSHLVARLPAPAIGEVLPSSLRTDVASLWIAPDLSGESPSLVGTLMLSVVGLLLLVFGLVFAISSHRAAAARTRPPARKGAQI